jgi:hypothetical protein
MIDQLRELAEAEPFKRFAINTRSGKSYLVNRRAEQITGTRKCASGRANCRCQPLVPLRFPFLIDLHADPFERAPEESGNYERWAIEHAYVVVPAQAIVGKFLQSFKEFPPRQKPASFSVDQALKAMQMGND